MACGPLLQMKNILWIDLGQRRINYWKDAWIPLLTRRLRLHQLEPREWTCEPPYSIFLVCFSLEVSVILTDQVPSLLYHHRETIFLNLVLIFEIKEEVSGPAHVIYQHPYWLTLAWGGGWNTFCGKPYSTKCLKWRTGTI